MKKKSNFRDEVLKRMKKADSFTTLEALELMNLKKKFLVSSGTLDEIKKPADEQINLSEWIINNFDGFCEIASFICNMSKDDIKALKIKEFEIIIELSSQFLQEVETPDFFTHLTQTFLQLIKL